MDAYQRVIDVNLMGLIRVTKAFLPLIRRAKGRVVNISSVSGKLPGYRILFFQVWLRNSV